MGHPTKAVLCQVKGEISDGVWKDSAKAEEIKHVLLTVTSRGPLLHRAGAERLEFNHEIQHCWHIGWTCLWLGGFTSSGRLATWLQVWYQHECLRVFNRCWACLALALVRVGCFLLCRGSTGHVVGATMTADKAFSAGGVAIVRIYGQEATTPATASATLHVRWLF